MNSEHEQNPPEHGPHLLRSFKLERFFSRYEFKAPYLLCCSDSEPLQLSEVLELADDDSRRRWEQLSLAYTEAQGLPALREAVATSPCHYTTVEADELIICAPEEGLYLAMLAALRPGDRVVVTYPGYQSLHEVALSVGCHVVPWELESGGPEGLHFDVQRLLGLLGEGRTTMVVVNFPHNPTGWLPTLQEWEEIVEGCRRAGAILFSDEMYRGMEFDPRDTLPAAADMYNKAISLSGMSKAVGLPGLRIGWLASHNTAVMARISELKDYTTICSSAPSEVLALAGVRAWPALAARQMALIRANLAAVEAFFKDWEGVLEWAPPRGGTTAFTRLSTGEDVEAFCTSLVEEAGVLLLPASVYNHAPSSSEGRFRLGFSRTNLPQCLQRLGDWLAKKYPRGGAAA